MCRTLYLVSSEQTNTDLEGGDDAFPCKVEDLLIAKAVCGLLDVGGHLVVVAVPDDLQSQQEGRLVALGIADCCHTHVKRFINNLCGCSQKSHCLQGQLFGFFQTGSLFIGPRYIRPVCRRFPRSCFSTLVNVLQQTVQ